jgi:hypothetical protein
VAGPLSWARDTYQKLAKAPAARSSVGAGDEKTNDAGIKESLAVCTDRAVKTVFGK